MFRIGDFSRMTQVTVKALRYYDDLGLLKPAHIDRLTGYRYYSASQLPRLNRILALKDLGLSLEQIGPLLDAALSPDQLRGLLLVKQAELREQLAVEQARLLRVEARLRQIEQETTLAGYDVVIKRIGVQRVAAVRAVLPNHAAVADLFRVLAAYQRRHGLTATAWLAIWHDPDYRELDVDAEATFASPDPLPSDARVQSRELPAVETMACTVHQGPPMAIGSACGALLNWIEANGHGIAGPRRALSLQRGGDPNQDVTEIQVPVAKLGDADGAPAAVSRTNGERPND